jgi:uncharacterized OsmC-like protein
MNQTGTASPTVEVSQVRVYSAPGRVKNVLLPVDADPVPMGLHGGVAAHYRAPDDIEPHATTLDYLIASAAACLAGTLGGMLRAIGQSTSPESFVANGQGTIVNDHGVLRVAAVHVTYELSLSDGVPGSRVESAHERHVRHCPIAKTIGGCVNITTSVVLR